MKTIDWILAAALLAVVIVAFQQLSTTRARYSFTFYHLPGCKYCEEAMPAWRELRRIYRGPAVLRKVNALHAKQEVNGLGINGFPAYVLFDSSTGYAYRYKTKMQPIAEGEGGAAYTRNKSDVRLCVPESLEERDVQTALFVALHELAHIANVSWGHDEKFWETFRDLLRLAVRAKIYKRRNYRDDPARYCGQDIMSQPLDWNAS